MHLLELPEFLKLFSKKPPTFFQFTKKAMVKSGEKMTSLSVYAKDKDISESDLRLLYENIVERNMYLERFYKLSLSVSPSKLHIVEPPMKNGEMNNTQLSIYKNLIRNIVN